MSTNYPAADKPGGKIPQCALCRMADPRIFRAGAYDSRLCDPISQFVAPRIFEVATNRFGAFIFVRGLLRGFGGSGSFTPDGLSDDRFDPVSGWELGGLLRAINCASKRESTFRNLTVRLRDDVTAGR